MADRFDLDAIDADDALLDLLAAGGESAYVAGEHDPAVKLLAELRLAVEVEDELPVETIDDPESFLARCAALNPVTDPFARKVAARGLALGVAAVAALSVSGVAAAVTGDPLSPYEKVIEKMVDAVRPQTSFPKEQLDGMPVVDKTKIVKVAKDYQKKQEEKAAEDKAKTDGTTASGLPQVTDDQLVPPLARPPVKEQPSLIQVPVPPPTQTTQPPSQTGDGTTQNPTTDPTGDPTQDPTTGPTEPPATQDPTTDPTAPPTTDPTAPPATEPTDPPSTPPADNGETGTGETGTGSDPTTAPSGDTGDQTGSDSGSQTVPGTGDTQPGSDTTVPGNTPGSDPGQTGDGQTPGTDQPEGALTGLLEKVLPVLPTPSGVAAELKSAESFFGDAEQSAAKHSSGEVATGSVKATYVQGRHSTGQYAEGKHAAIERTHGSLEDQTVLQILGVVNKQTS